MGGAFNWFTGIWNVIVDIAPAVLHTACKVVEAGANAIKLGGS